jgi:hypothetical protein
MDELFNIQDMESILLQSKIFIIGDFGRANIDYDLQKIITQYCKDKKEELNERLSAL